MTIKFTSLIQIKQLLPKYNDLEVMQIYDPALCNGVLNWKLYSNMLYPFSEKSSKSCMEQLTDLIYEARFCKNSDLAQKKTMLKQKINIVEIVIIFLTDLASISFNFFVKVADEPLFFSYEY
ncbi:hypothetical protein T08_4619 [Trichinella sp. T8]|nr:hypothetical protein T08_4619 [Trichinella sp. T8]